MNRRQEEAALRLADLIQTNWRHYYGYPDEERCRYCLKQVVPGVGITHDRDCIVLAADIVIGEHNHEWTKQGYCATFTCARKKVK